MLIIHLILAGLLALIAAAVLVLISPTRRCARCKGELVCRSRWTGRLGGCKRCRGTGRHYRHGATLVHKIRWIITRELRELAAERRERISSQPEGRQ